MRRKKNSHNLYLGVDGGGTKTHVVLINDEKNIVGEGFSGASNPLRVGIENAIKNIFSALTKAADVSNRSKSDIVSATK